MDTHFTPEQLRDPRLKEASDILQRCVGCGFCLAVCPTYHSLGDERDSPRGRIVLIHAMLKGELTPRQVRPHLDRCLSCNACMTACPSGVDYRRLSDYARTVIETSAMRAPNDESHRQFLLKVLPNPKRFRLVLLAISAMRPFRKLIARSRAKRLARALELTPKTPLKLGIYTSPQTVRTTRPRRGRVALLGGCVQKVLTPEVNDATLRFLNFLGYDVTLAEEEGCCGALSSTMGKEAAAKAQAKKNIDVWTAERDKGGPLSAIIVSTAGCSVAVKDYAHWFAGDPAYAEKAKYVSSLARDISEFAAQQKLDAPMGWSDIRVAYHPSCALEHTQRIVDEPRRLLGNAGFTVVEIPDGPFCCGAAGTYNVFQAELAKELQEQKVKAISKIKPDCVATGSVGCMTQLASGAAPVVHIVELLDWAYGGPCPEKLKHLQGRIRLIAPEPEEETADDETLEPA